MTVPMSPVAKRRKSPGGGPTRAEFDSVVDILEKRGKVIADLQRTCSTQLQRTAQVQAELDALRTLVERRAKRR